ncbi:hypothetical protein [Agromyces sp. Marseille-Q5079]|uniref:hypothetical protein n=1 Tax=Agromyces sp. Marseille-Q5079 TaxID=3439059 RepID=UPI003D9C933D
MSEPDRAVLDSLAEFDDPDEATVVVDRGRDADADAGTDVDATVVVDRAGSRSEPSDVDATIVVARLEDADDDEATRVVAREASAPALTHAAEQIMKAPTRRDRRRPAPAPVSDDVLRTAEPGIGPGLADHYAAREVAVARPAPQPVLPAGPPPTRDTAAGLPSVARRSRRSAAVVLAAFVTACSVTVVGLAVVVVAAVAALLG